MSPRERIQYPPELPISERAAEIIETIRDNRVVIVAGDTGSGKTTQLPKMCLQAGRGVQGAIACTQPRRIAAVAVATRLAEEMGVAPGSLVGYKVRFRDRTGRQTRVKFMTDGILLAELQGDRHLAAYDTIIIDEAHERTLNIDFLLGVMRRLLDKRDDLRLVITSATIDTEKFSRHFGEAPVVTVAGRTYPVELVYRPAEQEDATYVEQAIDTVLDLHKDREAGDILVFMPTERDIRETVEGLASTLRRADSRRHAVVLPLFGRLSGADQAKIFRRVAGRKIVVATNVAETSLTVPGIRFVVDTGLARIASYSVRARTTRMPVTRIAKASCDQRAGRCGRVGPGVCIRLFGEDDYENRPLFTLPEIQRANLAEVILRMLAFGLGEPADFPFIDPPSPRAVRDGFELLREVGAIIRHNGRWQLTGRGRLMARLPLDPRISRMIVETRRPKAAGRRRRREADRSATGSGNCLREITIIAAALSIQDPRVRPADKEAAADAVHQRLRDPSSDFLGFVRLWDLFAAEGGASRSSQRRFCRRHFLSYQRMREWVDIHEQIRTVLAAEKGFVFNEEAADADTVHRTILSGHLRNIALKKEKNLYMAARNRPCHIHPGSALARGGGSWIMAAELVETSRLFARTVGPIRPEWLEPLAGDLCRYSYGEPHWSRKRGQVVASERVTLFGLVIVPGRLVSYARIDAGVARQIFIQTALVEGELGGNHAFLRHNRKLIDELETMEHRLRRREILVGDEEIFSFYEERLPAGICDRRSLERWLRENDNGAPLFLQRHHLVRQLPSDDELARFPDELDCNGIRLALEYHFEPGSEADGVTVRIPVDLVDRLDRDRFAWLVPGLLTDKITALLKGLPRGLRRSLVPVKRSAEELADALEFGRGNLYQALERQIERRFHVRISAADWPRRKIADRFHMRFRLVRGDRTLLVSRDFADLCRPRTRNDQGDGPERWCATIGGRYEKTVVTEEVLDSLPERIPVEGDDGRLLGYVWPALTVDADGITVRIRVVADCLQARRLSRQGLLALFRSHFKKIWKNVVRDIRLDRDRLLLARDLVGGGSVEEALRNFVLENVFGLRAAPPRSTAEFRERVTSLRRSGLYPACMDLLDGLRRIVDLHHRIRTLVDEHTVRFARVAGEQCREIREHLDGLVGPDYLVEADAGGFGNLERRLRAMEIRLQRFALNPAKDRQKAGQLAVHLQRLAACRAETGMPEAKRRLVDEYGEMVEEFRVSLFAQELKTAFAVSPKRLEEKWRQIDSYV